MKYQKYTIEDQQKAFALFAEVKNVSEVSRLLNIPRSTLKSWLVPMPKKGRLGGIKIIEDDINPSEYLSTEKMQKSYSFILAVYLCDGYISTYKTFRAPSIRFFNDSKYPKNTQEWADNLKILLPNNSINIYRKKLSNCNIVLTNSKKLLNLFPQHGSGMKHERKLILKDWQKDIITKYPEEFVRGCIQSDGCIYQHKQGKYQYKKYAFTNKSEDIIDFFLYALNQIGIVKEKYLRSVGNVFVIQNFKKPHLEILEKIISFKE
jgi:hypothetical protein